jgi:hypothetical protein
MNEVSLLIVIPDSVVADDRLTSHGYSGLKRPRELLINTLSTEHFAA